MEHEEAARLHAVERYISSELSAAEREAFENHLFDCPLCARALHFEMSFAAHFRAACVEPPPLRQRWWEWLRSRPALGLSFAANFVLIAGVVYLLAAAAHPRAAPQFTQPYFAPGPTLGASDVHTLSRGETSYAVRFPAPSAAGQTYFYEVLDGDGKRQASASLTAPTGGGDLLCLQIPIAGLPAGAHTLVVRGGAGGDMVSWSRFATVR